MGYVYVVGESIPVSVPDFQFKFKYISTSNGRPKGFSSKKGRATATGLVLDGEQLPYTSIYDTAVRGNRLIMVVASQIPPSLGKNVRQGAFAIEVSKIPVRTLEQHIDRAASHQRAHVRSEEFKRQGKKFIAVICPHCQAVVELNDLPETPYIYCRYCDSIFNRQNQVITKGTEYCLCDECQMFGRVHEITEFYFYFLLVVYGWRYKQRFVCDSCAHKIFIKTLLANFIFILGVPVSIAQKIKSMSGRDPNLRPLGKANQLLLAGQYQKAAPLYQQFYAKYPDHPGLRMNEGIGHLNGRDAKGAIMQFECALRACANYLPVIQLVQKLSSSARKS
jgi:hypothetical protein